MKWFVGTYMSRILILSIVLYFTEAQTAVVIAKKHTHDGNSSVEVIQKLASLRIGELNLITQ